MSGTSSEMPPVPVPHVQLDDALPPVDSGIAPPTADGKSPLAFRTISEVATEIGVPQHVLRFWETRFPTLKPVKRGGNRRYYRPADIALLKAINKLLYTDGYTIKGVQKLIAEGGVRALDRPAPARSAPEVAPQPAPPIAAEPALPLDAPPQPRPAISVDALFAIRDRLAGALAEARAA
jgi:DNA-binding transcriptional MerR regulator